MFDFINDEKLLLAAFPTVLVALNNALKKMGMSDRWCPLVNLVGGLGATPLLISFGCETFTAIVIAIMIGLSAGGFYDFQKLTIRGQV
jgi:hypothetical protein